MAAARRETAFNLALVIVLVLLQQFRQCAAQEIHVRSYGGYISGYPATRPRSGEASDGITEAASAYRALQLYGQTDVLCNVSSKTPIFSINALTLKLSPSEAAGKLQYMLVLPLVLFFAYLVMCVLNFIENSHCASPLESERALPSFPQYMFYCLTLGLEFLAAAILRAARHIALKTLKDSGHIKPPLNFEQQLAGIILHTSMAMAVTSVDNNHGVFEFSDFEIPHLVQPGNVRTVRSLVVRVDLTTGRALRSTLDGAEVTSEEALRVATWCLLLHQHPKVHIGGIPSINVEHKRAEIRTASIFSSAVNSSATRSNIFISMKRPNLVAMLMNNCSPAMVAHNIPLLVKLAAHSSTLRFYLAARSAIFSVLREFDLGLDPEAFFLASVVHSIDHLGSQHATPLSLLGESASDRDSPRPGMILAAVSKPLRGVLCSTKLKDSRVDWHCALYKRLRDLDPYLADRVDWCIGC